MAGFISCCAEAAQEAYNDVEKRRRKSPKMFDHHNEEASLNEDRKVTEMVQPGSGTGLAMSGSALAYSDRNLEAPKAKDVVIDGDLSR